MTILGHHTVAELEDLVKAKDYQVGQLRTAQAAFVWPDRNVQDAWQSDWDALDERYSAAHQAATSKIAEFDSALQKALSRGGSTVRASIVPAEDEYEGILRALTRKEGIIVRGDFQDMFARFTAAGGSVDMTKTPQPSAIDADLEGFQAADTGIKSTEGGARDLGKNVADNPAFKASLIAAGIAGIALVYVGAKVYLPSLPKRHTV